MKNRKNGIDNVFTVKEFSALANVTPQNVYQNLKGNLKPYLIAIGHRKYIDKSALEVYGITDDVKRSPGRPPSYNVEQSKVKYLEEQLSKKDEEINNLYRLLDQQQQINLDITKTLSSLGDFSGEKNTKKTSWWGKGK